MGEWYDDGRLTYPEAETLVQTYLTNATTRTQTTSVDVLEWRGEENSHHNRLRVYDVLCDLCGPATAENWAGRSVFELPTADDSTQ